MQRLNATASLVWQILGDDLTVGELADELADAFSVPREIVLADITPMLRSLHGAGFLDEVSTAPQPPAEPAAVDEVRLVSPPCGCLRSVEDLDWVAMTALQVDTTIFTVRSNDLAAHQLLVAARGLRRRGPGGGRLLLRRAVGRAHRRVVPALEGNSVLCQTTSTVGASGAAPRRGQPAHRPRGGHRPPHVGRRGRPEGGVALVPPHLARTVHEHRDELAAAGLLLADGPTDLDVATGEVHVRAGLPVDEAAVDTFVSLLPPRAWPGSGCSRRPPPGRRCPQRAGDGDALARLMAVGTTVLPHTVGAERLDPEILLGAIEMLAAGPEAEPPADAADVATWLIDVLT